MFSYHSQHEKKNRIPNDRCRYQPVTSFAMIFTFRAYEKKAFCTFSCLIICYNSFLYQLAYFSAAVSHSFFRAEIDRERTLAKSVGMCASLEMSMRLSLFLVIYSCLFFILDTKIIINIFDWNSLLLFSHIMQFQAHI